MFQPLKALSSESIRDYFELQTINVKELLSPYKSSCLKSEVELAQNNLMQRISCCSQELLQLIRYQSAKNNLSLVLNKNQTPDNTFFRISCHKDLIFENKATSQVIAQLFSELLQIDIKLQENEYQVKWNAENPFLCFKPGRFCEPIKSQKCYFASLYESKLGADVTFIVEGQQVQAHRIFVERCGYFKVLLKNRQECPLEKRDVEGMNAENPPSDNTILSDAKLATAPVTLPHVKFSAFDALLFFCYTSRLKEKDLGNTKLILELYELSHFLLFEDLINYCAVVLNSMINKENFLFFAATENILEDQYLCELFQWFLAQNEDALRFTVSHFTAHQAMQTYIWIRKYGKENLNMKFMEVMIEKLELNRSGEELLKILRQKTDEELTTWFVKKSVEE